MLLFSITILNQQSDRSGCLTSEGAL